MQFMKSLYHPICAIIAEIVEQLVLKRFQICPNCKQRTLLLRSVRAPLAMDKTLMLEMMPDANLCHRADCVSCGYTSASAPLKH